MPIGTTTLLHILDQKCIMAHNNEELGPDVCKSLQIDFSFNQTRHIHYENHPAMSEGIDLVHTVVILQV